MNNFVYVNNNNLKKFKSQVISLNDNLNNVKQITTTINKMSIKKPHLNSFRLSNNPMLI
jgi:hypothetical protein